MISSILSFVSSLILIAAPVDATKPDEPEIFKGRYEFLLNYLYYSSQLQLGVFSVPIESRGLDPEIDEQRVRWLGGLSTLVVGVPVCGASLIASAATGEGEGGTVLLGVSLIAGYGISMMLENDKNPTTTNKVYPPVIKNFQTFQNDILAEFALSKLAKLYLNPEDYKKFESDSEHIVRNYQSELKNQDYKLDENLEFQGALAQYLLSDEIEKIAPNVADEVRRRRYISTAPLLRERSERMLKSIVDRLNEKVDQPKSDSNPSKKDDEKK